MQPIVDWNSPITEPTVINQCLQEYKDYWLKVISNKKQSKEEVSEETIAASQDRYIKIKLEFLAKNYKDILKPGGVVLKYAPNCMSGELLRLDSKGKVPVFRFYEFQALRALGAKKGYNINIEAIPWKEDNWKRNGILIHLTATPVSVDIK